MSTREIAVAPNSMTRIAPGVAVMHDQVAGIRLWVQAPEITETTREAALRLAEALDGAIGPATALKIIEGFLTSLSTEEGTL